MVKVNSSVMVKGQYFYINTAGSTGNTYVKKKEKKPKKRNLTPTLQYREKAALDYHRWH